MEHIDFNVAKLLKAERLIDQAKCELLKIEPLNTQQLSSQNAAIQIIKLFQDGKLHELKRDFKAVNSQKTG